MPKIQLLSKEVAELIAAGEVVERPASVVKELLENSIDAGATGVTVEIKNGGITYIRVTDNGCGIARDDISAAFISHATSKISSREDLTAIRTLGFRGEALASIAAVSLVEVLTRTQQEETGTRYSVKAGECLDIDDAGCPLGTTIVVRDLFFNTPARMKFLKKDVSEANAVAGVVDRIALSNPHVSLRFIREGKSVLFTSGSGDLRTTVFEIFGKDFSDGLISAEYKFESVRVHGLVSKPARSRPNRNMQFFFVNGRLVKTMTASSALGEAYKNSIMVGKFPYCVLNIETPPELVDVNVHPAKIEVRFANERSVFGAVYHAAKNALENRDETTRISIAPKPDPSLFEAPKAHEQQMKIFEQRPDFWVNAAVNSRPGFGLPPQDSEKTGAQIPARVASPVSDVSVAEAEPSTIQHFIDNYQAKDSLDCAPPLTRDETTTAQQEEKEESIPIPDGEQSQEEDLSLVIGEAFRTYIIVQKGDSLFLVDKHAAHERLLFDKLVKEDGGCDSQVLLTPVTVSLSKEEYSAVMENLDVLSQSGFEAEDFGYGMVIVRECPMAVPAEEVGQVVSELAGYLVENRQKLISEKKEWLFSLMACKSAIKAGYVTDEYEREQFIKMLFSRPEIRYCPHGRPVMIEITKKELEKNFGRA